MFCSFFFFFYLDFTEDYKQKNCKKHFHPWVNNRKFESMFRPICDFLLLLNLVHYRYSIRHVWTWANQKKQEHKRLICGNVQPGAILLIMNGRFEALFSFVSSSALKQYISLYFASVNPVVVTLIFPILSKWLSQLFCHLTSNRVFHFSFWKYSWMYAKMLWSML